MNINIYGNGLNYPPDFYNKKLSLANDLNSIRAGIKHVLATKKGQRFMLPEFGSNLYLLLFEPLVESTLQLAKIYAEEAIIQWVNRIEDVVIDVVIGADATEEQLRQSSIDPRISETSLDHTILITVNYKLRNIMQFDTMVYPFYTQLGNIGG